MAKNKGIFINRDKIVEMINEIGKSMWDEFCCENLKQIANLYRCEMTANKKKAMLNLYFKADGTTTIQICGSNTEISTAIKMKLEEICKYAGDLESKSCSIKKLSMEWIDKLVKYLFELENVTVVENQIETNPKHTEYVFTSVLGDRLIINRYTNGTIVLQGKPAYVFSEAIAFISYCNEVTLDDIITSVNTIQNVDIKTSDVHNELKALLSNSYSNIDPVILKILSPSISLRKVGIELDDYSCYVFPALRALEGYIKYLFGLKGISIGYTFGSIFSGEKLTAYASGKVNDKNYENELERLFVYFKNSRHVHFHTEQILIGTTLIEDRQEAITIINEVLNLIESSYVNLFV